MRIVLELEYDGTHYYGWQKQENVPTLQDTLQRALSTIADEPIEVFCAGRTDAKVHALRQIVHFDTHTVRNNKAWVQGANSYLPNHMSIHWAKIIDDTFHARFSALSRTYQYVIYNHSIRPGILHSHVTWFYEPLDIVAMREAANYLIGEQDFNSFRSSQCTSQTSMRNVKQIEIERHGHFVLITIKANAFLHHMVRNIVGVLKKIGAGFESPHWTKEVLKAKDRKAAGETAPPEGLYLTYVEYPARYDLSGQLLFSLKDIIIPGLGELL